MSVTEAEIYLAGLLHDIGKFVPRAGKYKKEEVERRGFTYKEYAHAAHGALYVKDVLQKKLKQGIPENVITLIYRHHSGLKKNDGLKDYVKILKIADWLSSAEREEEEKKENKEDRGPTRIPCRAIFSEIHLTEKCSADNNNYEYNINPLQNDKSLFPVQEGIPDINAQLKKHLKRFESELDFQEDSGTLYYYLQKYLWCIPAQTRFGSSIYTPDISLFDHCKTTAAIARCLFREYHQGTLTSAGLETLRKELYVFFLQKLIPEIKRVKELQGLPSREKTRMLKTFKRDYTKAKNKKYPEKLFMLIKGDISGIQDFIFHITTKGAAKSLKGRSAFINFLTFTASRYFMDKMKLEEGNILYEGGGCFYLLAPYSCKDLFSACKNKFLEVLLEQFRGEIYCALDYIGLTPFDFLDFSPLWDKVSEKTGREKFKKWGPLFHDSHNNIFKIRPHAPEQNTCQICGNSQPGDYDIFHYHDEDKNNITRICFSCYNFMELGKAIQNSKRFSFSPAPPGNILKIRESFQKACEKSHTPGSEINSLQQELEKEKTYRALFLPFGYDLEFFSCKEEYPAPDIYRLNDTDFKTTTSVRGYYFLPTRLPNADAGHLNIKTFEQIAEEAGGCKKLGILKLDVDNLGQIFLEGLGDRNSVSRVSTLSRMLKIFFEGHINEFIKNNKWRDNIYTIFSGGDDTFIVGAYDKILLFASRFRRAFTQYTAGNSDFSFTASISIVDPHYTVKDFGTLADAALEKGKAAPEKNRVVLFEEVFTWKEFDDILNLSSKLENLVTEKKESRAVLSKIMRSTKGFNHLSEVRSKEKNLREAKIKMWHLAYYLRNTRKANKDIIEEIITLYEEIIFARTGNQLNPMFLPAAVRLAEFKTRKE